MSTLHRTLSSLALALLLTVTSQAQTPITPGDHHRTFVSSRDETTQPYRLFLPSSLPDGPAPLAVVLHGKGVDENAWFDFIPTTQAAEKQGYVIAAPYARGNYWYRGAAEQDVLDIIAEVRQLVDIDPDRIYLAGHSMGGWGTAWIGARNPQLFAAIAPMAGWAPMDLLPAARELRPFLIHDRTDAIVPVGNSRLAVSRLGTLGISHQYREETGYGHASRMITDNFDRLFAWFNQHQRATEVAYPSFATRDAHHRGRFHWVHVLELASFPSTGSVVCSPGPEDDTMLVEVEGIRSVFLDLPASPHRGKTIRLVARFDSGPEVHVQVDTDNGMGLHFVQSPAGEWTHSLRARSDLSAPVVPEVLVPWDSHQDDSNQQAFADRWAPLLGEYAEADFVALKTDMMRDQGWPLDASRVADTWCYPVEDLSRFELTAGRLLEWAGRDAEALVVAVSPETTHGEQDRVTVVAPVNLALEITGGPGELLMHRPDEILVRALRASGE